MPRRGVAVAVIVILASLIVLGLTSSFLVDWAWFSAVGYLGVFWTILGGKAALFFAVFAGSVIFLWVNGSPPKPATTFHSDGLGVRNVRLTRDILTVSTACRISETKIICQQIRYSLRSPKRAARSLIRPSLSRNQFTSELLHRMWSKNGKLRTEIP